MNKILRDVCKEVHVSRRAVQGYEKAGLVHPTKNKMGHLLYSEAEVKRIKSIKFLQDCGLTLREIVQFLTGDTSLQIKMLSDALAQLERKIIENKQVVNRLQIIIARYTQGKGSEYEDQTF